ncbi:MAG: hypothetical protein WCG06_04820, partial [Candidatus Omnitrophota bacterium]
MDSNVSADYSVIALNPDTGEADMTQFGGKGSFADEHIKGARSFHHIGDTLYVTSFDSHAIVAIDLKTGKLDTTKFGGKGYLENAYIQGPRDIQAIGNTLYIASFDNDRLVAIDAKTGELDKTKFGGEGYSKNLDLIGPTSVQVIGGILYVTSADDNRPLVAVDPITGSLVTTPFDVVEDGLSQEDQGLLDAMMALSHGSYQDGLGSSVDFGSLSEIIGKNAKSEIPNVSIKKPITSASPTPGPKPQPKPEPKPSAKPVGSGRYETWGYERLDGQPVEVGYEVLPVTGSLPANPPAAKAMEILETYEDINAQALKAVGNCQTAGDLVRCLATLEQMTLIYLRFFKSVSEETTLEQAAASAGDLTGGRALAKLCLSLKKEFMQEAGLVEGQPYDAAAPISDTLQQMLKYLDGEKTSKLITSPAETTEAQAPAKLLAMTRGEYREYERRKHLKEVNAQDYTDKHGTQKPSAAIVGCSAQELINILHQKGLRNLPTLEGGTKSYLDVEVQAPNGSQAFKMPYSYASNTAGQVHPLPAVYIALAYAKGQAIHQNSQYFPAGNLKIYANENRAVVSLPLGVHSAKITFTMGPIQEKGGIRVGYTDSGSSYAPGSVIRLNA